MHIRQIGSIAANIEQELAIAINRAIDTCDIGDELDAHSDEMLRIATLAEWLSYDLLKLMYEEWKWEGLDGIIPECVTKTSSNTLDIIGVGWIVSTQNRIMTRITINVTENEVESMECRFGIREPNNQLQYGQLNAKSIDYYVSRLRSEGDDCDLEWVWAGRYGNE